MKASIANRIIGIGSGIGDERIESIKSHATSQSKYRTPDSDVFIFVAAILSASINLLFNTGYPLLFVSNTVFVLPELSLITKESVVASIFLSLNKNTCI